jgi:pSer/pThr/pTyr-binding forkhead associated (FHA) protein
VGQLTRIGDHPTAPRLVDLGQRVLVGRMEPSDLVVDDASMSRQHALVGWRIDHWAVLDLESLNGTRVNGRRLERGEQARLDVGSEIVFGTGPAWCLTSDAPPSGLRDRP